VTLKEDELLGIEAVVRRDGTLDFLTVTHTQPRDFPAARLALVQIRDEIQRLLDRQAKCPFHSKQTPNDVEMLASKLRRTNRACKKTTSACLKMGDVA
jgi:hypothetical protein